VFCKKQNSREIHLRRSICKRDLHSVPKSPIFFVVKWGGTQCSGVAQSSLLQKGKPRGNASSGSPSCKKDLHSMPKSPTCSVAHIKMRWHTIRDCKKADLAGKPTQEVHREVQVERVGCPSEASPAAVGF